VVSDESATEPAPGGGRTPGSAAAHDASPAANHDGTGRAQLCQHPTVVAPLLLGALLTSDVSGSVTVRITEVEAYGGLGEDPGSHAHRRRTDRNAAMFGPVGHAYVYFTYGMHWCLNVVAHEPGVAGAVLVRAGQVVAGAQVARARRPSARSDRDLARGPARLAVALGVTGELDGVDLLSPDGPLRLHLPARDPWPSADRRGAADEVGADPARPVQRGHGVGPRTGVAGDGATAPWRFWVEDDPSVSPHRPAAPRRRRPA
jgi:DNA-3-methyladenine glycosylase